MARLEDTDAPAAEGRGAAPPKPAKPKCFVIMPFSVRESDLARYLNDQHHWQEVYEGLIRPAIENVGLVCERDDEDLTTRLIADNIWRKIETADIILCDLSAANPNVLLELGWALRADKRFILIKDETTPLNFDINQFYTFTYSHQLQPRALREAIAGLSNVIRTTLQDDTRKYSLVTKMSLSFSAIEAAGRGNLEVSLLNEVLQELRKSRAAPASVYRADGGSGRAAVKVVMFSHDVGFTQADAVRLKDSFEKVSLRCDVQPHIDPGAPDAIYIGALVGASEAYLALSSIPYEIKYILRPDYPDRHGGDSSGLTIGIGFMSQHYRAEREPQAEPVSVTRTQVEYLSEPGQTNTEFQRRLRDLTSF